MAQRTAVWEADLDEDLQDVDLNLAIGSYGQSGLYEDGNKNPISMLKSCRND